MSTVICRVMCAVMWAEKTVYLPKLWAIGSSENKLQVSFKWNQKKVCAIAASVFKLQCSLYYIIFMYHCIDLCRKRKPRKNTTKNWIPKELRTATSADIPAAKEDEAPNGELVTGAPIVVAANEDEAPIVVAANEDEAPSGELVTRVLDIAAANEDEQTTATSPPRSVKWVVKKNYPSKETEESCLSQTVDLKNYV